VRDAVDLQNQTEVHLTLLTMTRPDGSADPAFGNGGVVPLVLADGGRFRPTGLAVANGGRTLVVAGVPQNGPPLLARYDATTGALDPTFADGGRGGVTIAGIEALVARPDVDQLYVGGSDAAGRPAVARIWNQLIP
jgi:hypothetical protein